MLPGSATRVACPRWWTVSAIESVKRSRSSWAISSSPVASGICWSALLAPCFLADRGGDVGVGLLLGALRVVALAPAHVGVARDLALQLEDAVDQRLGARRAARHVNVDRQELVRSRH